MNREAIRRRIELRADVQLEGPASSCWFWAGATNANGYGRMTVDGKFWRAHRASYAAHNGPIPEGMVVRHTCGYRSCVNPDHLIVGTQRANIWDAIEGGTFAPGGCRMAPRPRPEEVDK